MATERVLITGASSGIGAALAHRYAQHGAKVILVARPSERLQSVTTAVHGVAFPGDVADLGPDFGVAPAQDLALDRRLADVAAHLATGAGLIPAIDAAEAWWATIVADLIGQPARTEPQATAR